MRSGFLCRAAVTLSRQVVRSYPTPWRDRYEGEVLALLEDSPARLRDVLDLARGLAVERVRATFEPGDRPLVLSTLVLLMGFARVVAIAAPSILAGWAAHYWLGPLPRAAARSAMLASVALMLVLIAVRTIRKYSSTANSSKPLEPLSNRAGRIYLGLAIPITFLMSWSSPHLIQGLGLLWWFGPVWNQIAARRPWQVEMTRAVHDMRTARRELEWALIEIERCERLVDAGMPAPLQQARDELARLERQREEAMATLHSLGYRATLVRSRFGDA